MGIWQSRWMKRLQPIYYCHPLQHICSTVKFCCTVPTVLIQYCMSTVPYLSTHTRTLSTHAGRVTQKRNCSYYVSSFFTQDTSSLNGMYLVINYHLGLGTKAQYKWSRVFLYGWHNANPRYYHIDTGEERTGNPCVIPVTPEMVEVYMAPVMSLTCIVTNGW